MYAQALSEAQQKYLNEAIEKIIVAGQTLLQFDALNVVSEWQTISAKIYIPLDATPFDTQVREDLKIQLVRAFKSPRECHIAIIVGDPGSGKSTFLRQLLKEQLEGYQRDKSLRLPIFLGLNKLNQTNVDYDNLLADYFDKQLRLTAAQIMLLQQGVKLLVLLDGYDEISHNGNLYQRNHWQKWPNAHFIITTRPEKFGTQLPQSDLLSALRAAFQPVNEAKLAAFKINIFNREQVSSYITTWLANTRMPAFLTRSKILELISSVSGLDELTTNPIILSMFLYTLPELFGEDQILKFDINKRQALYDKFVEQWFNQQSTRALDKLRGLDPTLYRIMHDQNISIATLLRLYSINLARFCLSKMDKGKLLLEFPIEQTEAHALLTPLEEDNTATFVAGLTSEQRTNLAVVLRSGCLLKCDDKYFRFHHKTLLEYFAGQSFFSGKIAELSLRSDAKAKRLELFNQWVDEPNLIQVWVEQAIDDENFSQLLYTLIETSKTDPSLQYATGNALTVLHRARRKLHNQLWQGIQVRGADLSNALLAGTNFTGAVFTQTNFSGANIQQTNFSEVSFIGCEWGPRKQFAIKNKIIFIRYLQGHPYIVVAHEQGALQLIHTNTGKAETPLLHYNLFFTAACYLTHLEISGGYLNQQCLPSQYAISADRQGTIYYWQLFDDLKIVNQYLDKIVIGYQKIESIDLSVQGDFIAVAGRYNKKVNNEDIEYQEISIWQCILSKGKLTIQQIIKLPFTVTYKKIIKLAFSNDAHHLLVINNEGEISWIELTAVNKKPVALNTASSKVSCVHWLSDNQTFLLGTSEGDLYQINLATRVPKKLTGLGNGIIALQNYRLTTINVFTQHGIIYVYDIGQQKIIANVTVKTNNPNLVGIAPNQKMLAIANGADFELQPLSFDRYNHELRTISTENTTVRLLLDHDRIVNFEIQNNLKIIFRYYAMKTNQFIEEWCAFTSRSDIRNQAEMLQLISSTNRYWLMLINDRYFVFDVVDKSIAFSEQANNNDLLQFLPDGTGLYGYQFDNKNFYFNFKLRPNEYKEVDKEVFKSRYDEKPDEAKYYNYHDDILEGRDSRDSRESTAHGNPLAAAAVAAVALAVVVTADAAWQGAKFAGKTVHKAVTLKASDAVRFKTIAFTSGNIIKTSRFTYQNSIGLEGDIHSSLSMCGQFMAFSIGDSSSVGDLLRLVRLHRGDWTFLGYNNQWRYLNHACNKEIFALIWPLIANSQLVFKGPHHYTVRFEEEYYIVAINIFRNILYVYNLKAATFERCRFSYDHLLLEPILVEPRVILVLKKQLIFFSLRTYTVCKKLSFEQPIFDVRFEDNLLWVLIGNSIQESVCYRYQLLSSGHYALLSLTNQWLVPSIACYGEARFDRANGIAQADYQYMQVRNAIGDEVNFAMTDAETLQEDVEGLRQLEQLLYTLQLPLQREIDISTTSLFKLNAGSPLIGIKKWNVYIFRVIEANNLKTGWFSDVRDHAYGLAEGISQLGQRILVIFQLTTHNLTWLEDCHARISIKVEVTDSSDIKKGQQTFLKWSNSTTFGGMKKIVVYRVGNWDLEEIVHLFNIILREARRQYSKDLTQHIRYRSLGGSDTDPLPHNCFTWLRYVLRSVRLADERRRNLPTSISPRTRDALPETNGADGRTGVFDITNW